jgi:pyruvate formate-lyase activating enzyme-like uncharacterized protein
MPRTAPVVFRHKDLYAQPFSGLQSLRKRRRSCLFINGICNAKCFYCPSTQNEKGQPMTNTLEFKNPNDFADYVRVFNIRGVSFSGGEPFMTLDRVLFFLKTLRSRISHPLYIWRSPGNRRQA